MNKAIFLDRDGVINKKGSSYYIYRIKDFILNEGVTDALKYFLSIDYLLIIITNQGGISKKLFSVEQLEKLHVFMKNQLEKEGVKITDIFYCPHHPDNETCFCRKPGTLLFERAISKYNIDPDKSYMIGDSDIDIQAAEKVGVKGILIPVNGNISEILIRNGNFSTL
jgi:D-glycero-D-manno-heptose 1,7-bisphosphate phosphatase